MTMGRKIVQAAAAKLAPAGGLAEHRPDLYLADNQKIATDTCRILIGWGQHAEIPATTAIENWITGSFNGMVRMDHRTLRFYPEQRAVEVVASWTTQTQPIEAAQKMARITPTRYLEAGTKQTWEVREDSDGQRYLARLAKDNLDELLAERRNLVKGGRSASFATIKREAGMIDLSEGDEIKFYDKGQLKAGRVVSITGEGITVKSGEQTVRVAEPAITEIVTKDPKTVGDYRDKVMEYWSRVLPKEYIQKWNAAGEPKAE